MTGNEIREKFLQYFERHGHRRVRSSPLLPANDPTLLFTNAGMNQFKDVFLGIEKRDYVRACSSQKCLRAGGKHNDLDEVGKTAPCGPCSEIHYYMGDDPSDAENCAANVNGPGDTITEIWNLVFMQFDRSEVEPGRYTLTPLPAPSVDTGMGLERLTVVLQGVKSNYETDLLKNIVDFVVKLSGREVESE